MYIPATRAERITKTVQFPPAYCPMPKTPSTYAAVVATRALSDALSHPTLASPFAKLGNSQLRAI